jgi:hypothetical protein
MMNSPPNKFKDKIDPLYKAIDENIKKIEEMIDLLKGIQIKVASVNLYGDGLDILNWKGRSSQLDTSKGLGFFLVKTSEMMSLVENTRSKPLILLGEFALRREELESTFKSIKAQVHKMLKMRQSYDALRTRIQQMMAKKLVNLVMLSIKKRERKLIKIELYACAQTIHCTTHELLKKNNSELSAKLVETLTCYYNNFKQGFQKLSDLLPELDALRSPETPRRIKDLLTDMKPVVQQKETPTRVRRNTNASRSSTCNTGDESGVLCFGFWI